VIDLEPAEPLRRNGRSLLQEAGLGAGSGRDQVQRPAVGVDLARQVSAYMRRVQQPRRTLLAE
jgi:hypothetical protein